MIVRKLYGSRHTFPDIVTERGFNARAFAANSIGPNHSSLEKLMVLLIVFLISAIVSGLLLHN